MNARWPPAITAWTSVGGVPNVGGISAASSTPSLPLVPAPTNTSRPPFLSARLMISTPSAIRSFSFETAAITFRSSSTMRSMMAADESLSMARLAGLIASVGSCCHFDWRSMAEPAGSQKPKY
jgi:hypothetical protein